jgi:uncharacterized protein DUF1761
MEVEVNFWAVLLAGLSSMVVGAVWYLPGLFGKAWAKMAKVDMKKKISNGESVVVFGSTFIASLVTAYVLAYVTFLGHYFFSYSYLQGALTTAFWLWLGLTAARFLVHDLFEGRRKKLTLINIAHEFFTIMIMALIIGWMGV